MRYSKQVSVFNEQLITGLSSIYSPEEARIICHLLLEHLTGAPWHVLSLDRKALLTDAQYDRAIPLTERLISSEPIQYVTGEAHFYGRVFEVNPSVLIPRPETEELIYWVLAESNTLLSSSPVRALDIGTGSGCIPITLTLELAAKGISSSWTAWDISNAALSLAQLNAEQLGAQTQFVHQDVFTSERDVLQELDLIVSNPPYVPEYEKAILHANVLTHEPGLALFVPDDDPLQFYTVIVEKATHWLRTGGGLYLEVHADYADQVGELMRNQAWTEAEVRKDLRGKARMVRAFKR
ncbi:MAG: peptide chain release factor N(5)-glutamine methyltransferase [Bacteroidota bacterium]